MEIEPEKGDDIIYFVDVPPSYPNKQGSFEEWVNVESFKTHEEALKFAQDNFGADENGMICLISQC